MHFIERYDLLVKIARYIREENTGTSEELAKKCDIAHADMVHDHVDILREFTQREGAEIHYDHIRKTYYFIPRGKFTNFKFVKDVE